MNSRLSDMMVLQSMNVHLGNVQKTLRQSIRTGLVLVPSALPVAQIAKRTADGRLGWPAWLRR